LPDFLDFLPEANNIMFIYLCNLSNSSMHFSRKGWQRKKRRESHNKNKKIPKKASPQLLLEIH